MTNPKLKKAELRDLVKEIYEERTQEKIANNELEPFIEDVFLAIEEALFDGYDVPVGNIGTFKVKQREARKGRNPQTGQEIEIKATRAIGFTPSKHVKDTFKAEQA